MNLLHLSPAIIAFIAAASHASLAKSPKTVVVDCGKGASLQNEIDKYGSGLEVEIFFTGVCNEDIIINKDLFTLNGDPNATGLRGGEGVINGELTVQGADNVALEFLSVTGNGVGIFVTDGGDVDINQSILHGNEFEGVALTNAAVARITGTDITNNADHRFGFGVVINRNSVVEFRCGNRISGNGNSDSDQIRLEQTGTLRQQRCDNPGDARDEIEARTDVDNSVALFAFNGSTMDIRGANINGPIIINGAATMRVQRSEIRGDVDATVNSLVGFRGNVDFFGTLSCDATSEIFGSQVGLTSVQCGQTCNGDVPENCGF